LSLVVACVVNLLSLVVACVVNLLSLVVACVVRGWLICWGGLTRLVIWEEALSGQ
jgi:hypothetical protein